MLQLLNSPGWLRFIGQRNIRTTEDALAYIKSILDNPNVTYWVIRGKQTNELIGVVTLIQRAYLEFQDIGFALLPRFEGQGYASSALRILQEELEKDRSKEALQAITLADNERSINLLLKLGFSFQKTIDVESERLEVYHKDLRRVTSQLS